jgi:hypothetical protein
MTAGAVAGVVGIEVGVVSGVFNLESSGVDAPTPEYTLEEYHLGRRNYEMRTASSLATSSNHGF